MQTLAAKDARQGFSGLIDTAQRVPVTIEKKGRPVAVVLSIMEYERLEAFEDEILDMRAKQAEKEGFIGCEDGEKLMNELLNAKN